MSLRLLDDIDDSDPTLSVINLIDVFLVIIAALLMVIASNPLNPFTSEDVTVIKNPGKANMEIMVKKGKKIKKYESTGKVGQGDGVMAGTAYKMKDGSFVYVPSEKTTEKKGSK